MTINNLRLRGAAAETTALAPIVAPVLPARMQAAFDARKASSAKSAFAPSPQQQAFFDWIIDGEGSLILRAAAGCGKTTTLIQALGLMQGNIFFGAYNKDISVEIKAKAAESGVARRGLFISTMHGVGYGGCMELFPRTTVDDRKVSRLVDTLVHEIPEAEVAKVFICQMVSFGKQFLAGVKFNWDNMNVWLKLMDHFSVDQNIPEDMDPVKAMSWAITIYKRSHEQCSTVIDFDDMIYAAIAYKARFVPNDWVLIDEAQDLNPARRELARKLLRKGAGRLVAVGDDRQAIYGFTGAGGNAIDLIKEEFKCAELPLSVTYRCPKAVVEYLYHWVPQSHIEAHPDAPQGEVRGVKFERPTDPKEPTVPWFIQDALLPTDVVLCRYNAPLVTNAFKLIREGIPCKIAGRDIGKGLMAIARMWKIKTLDKLVERLQKYLEKELAKAAKLEDDRRGQEASDKVSCLMLFIERCHKLGKTTIDELEEEILSMFSDKVEGMVTFSSGHKAKGREWTRVFWIQTAQRKRPRKAWEAEQEDNILYVIASRVKGDPKADPEDKLTGRLILVPEQVAA